MRLSLAALVLLAGCAPSAHAVIPAPTAPTAPTAAIERPAAPLSLNRIVTESEGEMRDLSTLARPIGDERGRARALAEVNALADELRAIAAQLRTSEGDGDRLDTVASELLRLQTRIALLHDRLRVAALTSTAVQTD